MNNQISAFKASVVQEELNAQSGGKEGSSSLAALRRADGEGRGARRRAAARDGGGGDSGGGGDAAALVRGKYDNEFTNVVRRTSLSASSTAATSSAIAGSAAVAAGAARAQLEQIKKNVIHQSEMAGGGSDGDGGGGGGGGGGAPSSSREVASDLPRHRRKKRFIRSRSSTSGGGGGGNQQLPPPPQSAASSDERRHAPKRSTRKRSFRHVDGHSPSNSGEDKENHSGSRGAAPAARRQALGKAAAGSRAGAFVVLSPSASRQRQWNQNLSSSLIQKGIFIHSKTSEVFKRRKIGHGSNNNDALKHNNNNNSNNNNNATANNGSSTAHAVSHNYYDKNNLAAMSSNQFEKSIRQRLIHEIKSKSGNAASARARAAIASPRQLSQYQRNNDMFQLLNEITLKFNLNQANETKTHGSNSSEQHSALLVKEKETIAQYLSATATAAAAASTSQAADFHATFMRQLSL